jgi:hypothetical protein
MMFELEKLVEGGQNAKRQWHDGTDLVGLVPGLVQFPTPLSHLVILPWLVYTNYRLKYRILDLQRCIPVTFRPDK